MAFHYDKKKHAAIDLDSHAAIKMSSKFYDTKDVPYKYEKPGFSFTFFVRSETAKRNILIKGGQVSERMVEVAIYLSERDILRAFDKIKMSGCINKDYKEFKDEIASGMYELGSRGGEVLRSIPDWRVGFMQEAGK